MTALASTSGVVTCNNLQAAWRAQQAGSAVNAADAGVAQAVAHLRSAGVRGLTCSPTCPTNAWGNQASPTEINLDGAAEQGYAAWIEPVAPFPANDPGLYRIHSTGTAKGAASRRVVADAQVSSIHVPQRIWAQMGKSPMR